MIRIGVAGAAGKMGSRISALSREYGGLQLAGAFEKKGHRDSGRDVGMVIGTGELGITLSDDVHVEPEECKVQVDVRVMIPGEWERLEAEMAKLKPVLEGTQIEITGGLNRPPMPFDDQMKATFEKAKSIAANIGMTLTAGGTGGASDGNFVAPLGIPLLDGMGAVGEGYHSEREFIFATNSIEQKTKLIAELIREW